MVRTAFPVFIALLGLSMFAGCDEKPDDGVRLGASPAASAMPPGHPPMGAPESARGESIEGTVAETMDVAGYTYLHLDAESGKVWAAVPHAEVAVGDRATVERAMPMKNFESPSLQRKFELIYFGVLAGGAKLSPHRAASAAVPVSPSLPIPDEIKVDKAVGANAHTVEEVFANAKDLSGKQIRVRGIVLKINKRIMGKNWVHLRDGTGSEAKKSHDLVITSKEAPQVGSTVVMVGKVATDKDFGSGYAYDVLVEEATFEAEGGQ